MAWFTRFTRFGDIHKVFGQEHGLTCGVACVIMAAFKINKLTPGVKSTFDENTIIKKSLELFQNTPAGMGSKDPFAQGQKGASGYQLLQLLNDPILKMPGWTGNGFPPEAVPSMIVRKVGASGGFGPRVTVNPMIVLLTTNGGRGHWVLIDTVRTRDGKTYATVCDPWDANVHVTRLKPHQKFQYTGKPEDQHDLGGKHTHANYDREQFKGAASTADESGKHFNGVVLCRESKP